MSARNDIVPVRRAARTAATVCGDVQYYLTLTPRQLPSRYFYDELGSALFDAICELPWYRITRAEAGLLAAHGRDVLATLGRSRRSSSSGRAAARSSRTLVQGGRLTAAASTCTSSTSRRAALDGSARALDGCRTVDVVLHEATYEAGSARLAGESPRRAARSLLFLGSNIGNFDPPGAEAFLRGIRAASRPATRLLLGADLVKPERDLLLAYDDPLGVTAAFNRNLLVRINRELGGDFDVSAVRPSRGLERGRVARRDAPGGPAAAASANRRRRSRNRSSQKARRSGPRAPTSTAPMKLSAWSSESALLELSSGSRTRSCSR